MTDQMIKNRANQLKEEELRETKRANKRREDIEGARLDEERHKRYSNERIAKSSQRAGILSSIIGQTGKVASALSGNHPSWYNKDKLAVHAAANISFDVPIGSPVPKAEDQSGFVSARSENGESIPLIETLAWMPSLGGTGVSPKVPGVTVINRAVTLLYDYFRNNNSGAKNYDYADLLTLVVALLEPRIFYAEARRLVAILNGPIVENSTTPRDLITALGYNYQDLIDHKNDLKGFVEQLGVDLKALPIPKIFTVAERQMWMASSVFKDSDTERAQLICFKRENYYTYNWSTGSCSVKTTYIDPATGSVTGLSGNSWSSTPNKTFEMLYAFGNELYNTVLRDNNIGNVVGDMLKSFGVNGLYFSEPGINDEKIEYKYDINVLDQIDNAIAIGYRHPTDWDIVQDSNGYLRQGYNQLSSASEMMLPVYVNGSTAPVAQPAYKTLGTLNQILNSAHDNPSEDDVMVKSRLMVQVKSREIISSGSSTFELFAAYTGTEVLTWVSYYWRDPISQIFYHNTMSSFPVVFNAADTVVSNVSKVSDFTRLLQFTHRPVMFMLIVDGNGSVKIIDENRDYTNYAIVPSSTIANIHRVAITSEWGIPDIIAK